MLVLYLFVMLIKVSKRWQLCWCLLILYLNYLNNFKIQFVTGRARKNLRSFIPVPSEPKRDEDKKTDLEDDKKVESVCNQCKEDKICDVCVEKQDKTEDSKKMLPGRKLKKPRKNRKAGVNKQEGGQCFFPMSMSMLYGPLGNSTADVQPPAFPYNVTFKQVSYIKFTH